MIAWPPAFTFKRHPRAKQIKLKASPQRGLEIIAPLRFNLKRLPEVLEINKAWIMKNLTEAVAMLCAAQEVELPEVIYLHACNQVWHVQYIKSDLKKLKIIQRPHYFELVILGNIDNKKIIMHFIADWIKAQAQVFLSDRIKQISLQTNLTYKKVSIRGQRTRWGSCTASKNISLNYKLIFLPKNLVDYIIIHELCHTVHLNHSPRFWRLVESFDPSWKQHNREMRDTTAWIPGWILS